MNRLFTIILRYRALNKQFFYSHITSISIIVLISFQVSSKEAISEPDPNAIIAIPKILMPTGSNDPQLMKFRNNSGIKMKIRPKTNPIMKSIPKNILHLVNSLEDLHENLLNYLIH